MESKDAGEIESQPGVETETVAGYAATTTNMKDRKFSWAKLRRIDSLNLEAGIVPSARGHSSQVSFPFTVKKKNQINCPLTLKVEKIKHVK